MKKNIILFVSLFVFFSFSFAQNIEPKFEKQKNLTKVTYYYDNGKVKETGFFKNNKLHGKWMSYKPNGEITTIAFYKNGIKTGNWYIIANNSVKELTYKNNKLIHVKNTQKKKLSVI